MLGLPLAIGPVDLRDVDHGEEIAVVPLEREPVGCRALGRRQRHGDRPWETGLEVHLVDDPVVVGLAHEAGERRERARGDHVEVGRLLLGQPELRQALGVGLELRRLVAHDDPAHELAAVRGDHAHVLAKGRGGLRHATASSSTGGMMPSLSSSSSTNCAESSGLLLSVSTTTSAWSGASYGSLTPVNSLISPENALA